MPFNIRTDLALESRELVRGNNTDEVPGVNVEERRLEGINITKVKITTEEGSRALGKAIGNYITLEIPDLKEGFRDLNERASKALSEELANIIDVKKYKEILVVGLGNWNVTPDALGPKVVSKVAVTRHLVEYASEYIEPGTRSVCSLAPGVLGITGIETGEIIKGVIEKIKPDLVIAIDALASRRMERVSTTIQVADTGINPGSGVGNKRMGLNSETLGVPVIAIGVPTVVEAATLTSDTLDLMIESMTKQADKGSEFYKILEKMNDEDKYKLIKEILSPYTGDLVVTPKEIDAIISNVSEVVADGINIAAHGTIEDAKKYLN